MPRSPIQKLNMIQADSCVTFMNNFMSHNPR